MVVRIVDDGDIAVVKGHYLILFPRAACRIKIPCVNRTALLCRLCAVSDLGASQDTELLSFFLFLHVVLDVGTEAFLSGGCLR